MARKLWNYEYDLSLNKRKYCGHNRLKKIDGACASMPTIGKCNYKWGVTKFVLLTGHCFKAGILQELEKSLKLELHMLQHCKIKKDGKFIVGIYVGNENVKVSSSTVYQKLSMKLEQV